MFDTVLIANRGEIAVRIARTLRAMSIRSVAVYSDADRDARHVRTSDVAVHIGPSAAKDSYLSVDAIIAAAKRTGAQAVHPGYGFLSENVALARACAAAGLVFVGPPVAAIESMGDKIRAKQTVQAAGVPVVPGVHTPGLTDDDLVAAADRIGYPVLLKPSAGGGGKGMREVSGPGGLIEAITSARREARGSFGDDTLLIERLVQRPRHIEIQVIADSHGTVLHLGERECSLQRRHQKIIEEAPSVLLDAGTRSRMGAAAVEAARSVGYTGAGTVEFIVGADRPGEFFFLEMNTRLQVEHPVTEAITDLDLVELQLRVAAGEPLGLTQADVVLTGHAVEARIYAEDPARGFLPTGGTVLGLTEPDGAGVRVDSGLAVGTVVGSDYDPMLAKVIAWGTDRQTALRRLDAALAGTAVLGVRTNVAFLRRLLALAEVEAGDLDTGLIGRRLAELTTEPDVDGVLGAAALARLLDLEPTGAVVDPFDVPGGWRLGEPAWVVRRLRVAGHDAVDVAVRGRPDDAQLRIGAGDLVAARVVGVAEPLTGATVGRLRTTYDGVSTDWAVAVDETGARWFGVAGSAWLVSEQPRLAATADQSTGDGRLTSPMPGTVTVVQVSAGESVRAGQPLLVVEAMKMEHVIVAPTDGVVTDLYVASGQQVPMDAPLAVVVPAVEEEN